MTYKVSYVDFTKQYELQREKILEAFDQTMAEGNYILGEPVQQLEKYFAESIQFCWVGIFQYQDCCCTFHKLPVNYQIWYSTWGGVFFTPSTPVADKQGGNR